MLIFYYLWRSLTFYWQFLSVWRNVAVTPSGFISFVADIFPVLQVFSEVSLHLCLNFLVFHYFYKHSFISFTLSTFKNFFFNSMCLNFIVFHYFYKHSLLCHLIYILIAISIMFMDGFYRVLIEAAILEKRKVLMHQDMVNILIPDAIFHASGANPSVIQMIVLIPYRQSSILEAPIHSLLSV